MDREEEKIIATRTASRVHASVAEGISHEVIARTERCLHTRLPLIRTMAKYRLDEKVTPLLEVFGISCHVPDYRLCWSLNKGLSLDLTRRREDIVEDAKGRALHYPVFEQRDEEGELRWWLVANLCGRRRLLPQQKQADYFLVVDAGTAAHERELFERLRGAEFVLTAYVVDQGSLKMGHKLLL